MGAIVRGWRILIQHMMSVVLSITNVLSEYLSQTRLSTQRSLLFTKPKTFLYLTNEYLERSSKEIKRNEGGF